VERGFNLYLLNRGQRGQNPPGCQTIVADIARPDEVRATLSGIQFDVVVNWIAYTPDDIERDLALFQGKVNQYIFISSASAYQKPPAHPVITESTPLYNPYWEYSRLKIACEERLLRAYRETGFPATIPFRDGIRRTLAWFDADDRRKRVDENVNGMMARILAAYDGRSG
jgi:nucleoside-diphosphate-sugar epimerase